MTVVLILAGGAVGAVVRYLVARMLGKRGALPWAVLTVNVVGCAIGGTALGLADTALIGQELAVILLGGVAGGLTTFSTWSVEAIQLLREGKWRSMALSVTLNLVLGLVAAAAGWAIVAALATPGAS